MIKLKKNYKIKILKINEIIYLISNFINLINLNVRLFDWIYKNMYVII
jgi:hypothetical protein